MHIMFETEEPKHAQYLYTDGAQVLKAAQFHLATEPTAYDEHGIRNTEYSPDPRRSHTIEGIRLLQAYLYGLTDIVENPDMPFIDPVTQQITGRDFSFPQSMYQNTDFIRNFYRLLDREREVYHNRKHLQVVPTDIYHPESIQVPYSSLTGLNSLIKETFDQSLAQSRRRPHRFYKDINTYEWYVRRRGALMGFELYGLEIQNNTIVNGLKSSPEQALEYALKALTPEEYIRFSKQPFDYHKSNTNESS